MKLLIKWLAGIALAVCSVSALAGPKETVVSITADEKVGYQQKPIITIEAKINKTRDMHLALQDGSNGWKTIKSRFKRVKKAGKHSFQLDISELKPGQYRWNSYITPRGKDWNSRLGNTVSHMFEVVDAPVFKEPVAFSSADSITQVDWPKAITDDKSYTLKVDYKITEPRVLHITLANKKGWKEEGAIEVPVSEPGNIAIPFDSLVSSFAPGNYVWMVYLADNEGNQVQKKKLGKHFTLGTIE